MNFLKSYALFENNAPSIKEELEDILLSLTDRGIDFKIKTPEDKIWIVITGRLKSGLLYFSDIVWSEVSGEISHAKNFLESRGWVFKRIDGTEIISGETREILETDLDSISPDSKWSIIIVEFI